MKPLALCGAAATLMSTQLLSAGADPGLLGAKLSAAENSHDLFRFFHLEEVGHERREDGRTLTTFKPAGDTFRSLVTLSVTTDADGAIERMRLEVARKFIDDAHQGIFAADLTKSFLAGSDGDGFMALANEIHDRALLGSHQTVITAQPTPSLRKSPTLAYQTYAGQTPASTIASSTSSIQATLRNLGAGDAAKLQITVAPASR